MFPTFILYLSKVIKLSWNIIKTPASYMPSTDQTYMYVSESEQIRFKGIVNTSDRASKHLTLWSPELFLIQNPDILEPIIHPR